MLISNLSPLFEYFNIFLRMFIFLKLQCNGETTLENDNLPFFINFTLGQKNAWTHTLQELIAQFLNFFSFQNHAFSVYVIIPKSTLFPVRDLTHLTLRNLGINFFPYNAISSVEHILRNLLTRTHQRLTKETDPAQIWS